MAEENRDLTPQELKPFLVYARHLGFKNLNPQQEKAVAEFLSGSDVFVNLPTGHGKPLIYHMTPLVKAAQLVSKRKHSSMQNLPERIV